MECEEWDGNADARNQRENVGNLGGKVKKMWGIRVEMQGIKGKLRNSGRNYIQQQWKW